MYRYSSIAAETPRAAARRRRERPRWPVRSATLEARRESAAMSVASDGEYTISERYKGAGINRRAGLCRHTALTRLPRTGRVDDFTFLNSSVEFVEVSRKRGRHRSRGAQQRASVSHTRVAIPNSNATGPAVSDTVGGGSLTGCACGDRRPTETFTRRQDEATARRLRSVTR